MVRFLSVETLCVLRSTRGVAEIPLSILLAGTYIITDIFIQPLVPTTIFSTFNAAERSLIELCPMNECVTPLIGI
jgi:hypothetical protein